MSISFIFLKTYVWVNKHTLHVSIKLSELSKQINNLTCENKLLDLYFHEDNF